MYERKETKMKDIEQELKDGVMVLASQLKEAKPGSDEQKAIADSLVKVAEENLKYLKGEDDIFNNDAQRQKLYAEVEKLKAEVNRIENDIPGTGWKAWVMQMRPDQAANIIVILMITGATVSMEKHGHILPDRILKGGMKLFRA